MASVHFPLDDGSQVVLSQAEARSQSHLILLRGQWPSHSGHPPLLFPGDQQWGQPGYKASPVLDVSIAGSGATHYATTPALGIFIHCRRGKRSRHWFTYQMPATPGAGPGRTQEPRTHLSLSYWVSNTSAIICSLPEHELAGRQNGKNQDINPDTLVPDTDSPSGISITVSKYSPQHLIL